MTKFVLTINVDGPSFDERLEAEIASVLRKLAYRVEKTSLEMGNLTLLDSNGSNIGKAGLVQG